MYMEGCWETNGCLPYVVSFYLLWNCCNYVHLVIYITMLFLEGCTRSACTICLELCFIVSILSGHLTAKSDVYSFGVVLLEMMSGRRAIDKNRPQGEHNLVEWARPYLTHKRKIFRVLDTRLEGQYSHVGAQTVATLALECLSYEAKMRPSMEAVVTILEELQESSHVDRKPAAERRQESTTGTGKKAPTANASKNSGKPRRKSLGETREKIGPNPTPLVRSH